MRRKKLSNDLSLPYKFLLYFLVLIMLLTMIVPLINVLATAFSSTLGSMRPGIRLWPDEWTTEGFRVVWNQANLSRAFFNSVFVSGMATFIQMLLSAFAGYVILQKDLPGKKFIISFILLTMMIPGDLTLMATFSLNRSLGFLNTYRGLIINGLISGFSIILMRNYFLSVPTSLAESARIDGASEFKIFWRVYLPLSLPGLATLSFLEFTGKWNSMILPMIITTNESMFTLPVLLRAMIFDISGQSGTTFIGPNVISAGIVITIIPLVVFYAFAQRFLIKGITLGAEKG